MENRQRNDRGETFQEWKDSVDALLLDAMGVGIDDCRDRNT